MMDDYRNHKRELRRDAKNGKIFGVCAGVAKYFDVEVWVVRLTVLGMGIWMPPMVLFAYFIATWLLDVEEEPKRNSRGESKKSHYQSQRQRPPVRDVWRAGTLVEHQLSDIEGLFDKLESRLRNLEKAVTSSQFQLNKKFREIK